MRNCLYTFLLILNCSSLMGQNNIQLFNGDKLKINFNFINDSLAYLSFDEYEDNSFEYILGKYRFMNDQLTFEEIDILLISKFECFYGYDKNIPSDKIELEVKYSDVFIDNAKIDFDSLSCMILGEKLSFNNNERKQLLIVTERPKIENFEVEFFNYSIFYGSTMINLPTQFNKIRVKMKGLSTFYSFAYEVDNLIPEVISINGKNIKLNLVLN